MSNLPSNPVTDATPVGVWRAITASLIRDLTSRGGLQNAWDEIDAATQSEITVEWCRIIHDAITADRGAGETPVRRDALWFMGCAARMDEVAAYLRTIGGGTAIDAAIDVERGARMLLEVACEPERPQSPTTPEPPIKGDVLAIVAEVMCHSFDGQDRTYYLKAIGRESFEETVIRRLAPDAPAPTTGSDL